MAEIHLRVADAEIRKINERLRRINGRGDSLSASEIGREALGLYRWAIDRMAEDYAICAVNVATGAVDMQVGTPSTPVRDNPRFADKDVSDTPIG